MTSNTSTYLVLFIVLAAAYIFGSGFLTIIPEPQFSGNITILNEFNNTVAFMGIVEDKRDAVLELENNQFVLRVDGITTNYSLDMFKVVIDANLDGDFEYVILHKLYDRIPEGITHYGILFAEVKKGPNLICIKTLDDWYETAAGIEIQFRSEYGLTELPRPRMHSDGFGNACFTAIPSQLGHLDVLYGKVLDPKEYSITRPANPIVILS